MLLTRNTEPLLGVLLGLILAAASSAQNNCTCASNKWMVCAQNGPENCACTLVGSSHKVDCSMLMPWKAVLLMKAEMMLLKGEVLPGPSPWAARYRWHLQSRLRGQWHLQSQAVQSSRCLLVCEHSWHKNH